MSCRATGCDGREWMARKLCDRHWKMLPVELQVTIRQTLERNRRHGNSDAAGLQLLLDEAQTIITAREEQEHTAREVGLFRTHMASVAGVVAALRTIPVHELRVQLLSSAVEFEEKDPDSYAEQRVRIDMDLAVLEVLCETSDKLGEVIKRFAPAPAEDDGTVEMHTNAPRGIGE